ncbi:MAG TPA: DUF3040 domain-containing protein [Streptosporangiaceae bacterium]
MPLSDHEQRMLDQIEKALYAEDPKFANSVRARDPRVHYRRRMIQAAVGFLIGVGLLLAGVVTKYIWMGVAGFLVMLTCSMWALTSWRHMNGTLPGRTQVAAPAPGRRRGRSNGQGFMERLEERWRRRQESDGR